jgi:translation initiation factor eIF-2B subunit beta
MAPFFMYGWQNQVHCKLPVNHMPVHLSVLTFLLRYLGHIMTQSLSSVGTSTFLVPDSSIWAIISRISKVILGAHTILANGRMFAITGSLLAAMAAQAHSTPVVVCTGQFKLTPLWNLYHDYGALDFVDPSSVLGFEEGCLVDKVDVISLSYHYIHELHL